MLVDYGYFILVLCFVASVYGTLASLGAAWLRHSALYQSARMANIATAFLTLIAALLLWYLFFTRDYSALYVYKNSSDDLPYFYTITAFWCSLEGSHFLWTLLLAIYSLIAHLTYTKDNEHIMPYVSAFLQFILSWMFYLAITYSDPFGIHFPAAEAGLGMNPLLQNFYMAIHPPSLFTGYTALAIPCAYAMAALAYGDITQGWLVTVRRWTLYAWTFLTVGIFLGGRWAYMELGWAGYWAWDPVENSSFMPWLFSTALLHALLVQDKLGHLKRLSLILAFFAFFFSFFGTFITRSGVVSSVHSFAQSPIGPNYLGFLGLLMAMALGLYAWRSDGILPASAGKVWGVSKESALVLSQFLFLTFAMIVFVGTMYPIVSEALSGVRSNVQAPYFNTFAPYLGFAFALSVGIATLMHYQSSRLLFGAKGLVVSCLVALVPTLVFAYFAGIFASKGLALGMQLIGAYLTFWSFVCLSYHSFMQISGAKAKWGFFERNLAHYGSYVAHVGFLVAVLGFLGNYRGIEKTVTLNKGETFELFGYGFRFDGVRARQEANVSLFEAVLHLTHDAQGLGELLPARAKYPTKPELFHEVGIFSTFWHDVYAVLSDYNQTDGSSATVQVFINPTVRIVWMSVVLMALGGIIALCDRYRGRRSRDNLTAALALMLVVGFGAPVVKADETVDQAMAKAVVTNGIVAQQSATHLAKLRSDVAALSPEQAKVYEEIGSQLRCPTCSGLSVLQSDADFSVQIRQAIVDQLNSGQSEEDVVKFFSQRYGIWILRQPPTAGFHLIAWVAPIAIFLLGLFTIWLLFWRQRRQFDGKGIRNISEILQQMEKELAARRI